MVDSWTDYEEVDERGLWQSLLSASGNVPVSRECSRDITDANEENKVVCSGQPEHGTCLNRDRTDLMLITGNETADIPVSNGNPMRIHIFRPAAEGRYPGVVVFSEIYQVTAPIRRLAAVVAGLGHVVSVPEVYHEYEPAGTVLTYDKQGTDRGNALKTTKTTAQYDADSRAALDFLAAHSACTGHLASMGVCLGGHLALRAALDPRVLAAACFYATDVHTGTLGAGGDDTLSRLAELSGEAMFVWGRNDPHMPFAGRQLLRERLEAAGARYEWHEVDGAHAFLRDEGPRYDPALFLQAMSWVSTLFGRTLHAVA